MAKISTLKRDRATGIGGSDAPVLCGVARWKTPLQLWAEKTRAMEGDFDDGRDDDEMLMWGTILEPKILQVYERRSGRVITIPKGIVRHPSLKWMIAHPDAIQKSDEGLGIVEVKNVSRYVSDRWLDGVPVEVNIQAQHYMAVMGLEYATAVGLIGGHRLVWEDVRRNQKFIDALLEREHDFWTRVISDNPPTATAADNKFLNTLVQPARGKLVILGGNATDLDRDLEAVLNEIEKVNAVLSPLEERRDELQAQIKQMIGDAEEAHLPTGQIYTFKEVVRKAHEVKESRYRKLVRKK